MKKVILLLFCMSFLYACSNKEQSSSKKAPLSYKYHKKIIFSSSNDTLAEISYPLFNDENLNKYLTRSIFYPSIPTKESAELTTFDSIAAKRITSYDNFYHEQYFPPKNWRLLIDINLKVKKQNYISISYKHVDYIRKNPNYTSLEYFNYNLKNNTPIEIDSILVNGKLDDFSKICESAFRRKYNVRPNSSLKDYFYYAKFEMPRHFYLDDEAIVFEYKPYEIKSRNGISNTLTVPYDDLRNILNFNLIKELL